MDHDMGGFRVCMKHFFVLIANICQYTKYTKLEQLEANNRHGLECPEERDYYPYWHPTPWHLRAEDLHLMADMADMCMVTRCERDVTRCDEQPWLQSCLPLVSGRHDIAVITDESCGT